MAVSVRKIFVLALVALDETALTKDGPELDPIDVGLVGSANLPLHED
jgi:hypothetical protein